MEKKSIDLIGNQTRIVPQPTAIACVHFNKIGWNIRCFKTLIEILVSGLISYLDTFTLLLFTIYLWFISS
jgi:hypothetical protein